MLATRILLVVIPLAASTPGCFDPTLRPDGHEPVTDSSSTDALLGESSAATSENDVADSGADSTSWDTGEGESTNDVADSGSTADDPIDSQCGDGRIGTDEDCDDANDRDGDGCSACTTDPGWECHDEPSVCLETCGPLPQNCLHP